MEEAIKAGWKTAEEIYTTANSSKRSWDRFIADVRNAISQKSNFSCAIDGDQKKEYKIYNCYDR